MTSRPPAWTRGRGWGCKSDPLADPETGVVSITVGSRGSDALVEAVRALDGAGVETRGLALRAR